ncbi:hypothetical protein JL720_8281 [Aureococcus anophagefferens]|nr:hypothetical protein JL720_8281 [Aureococcus anophagefferens]
MGAAKLHEWVASPAVVTCVALGPRSHQVLASGGEDKRANVWRLRPGDPGAQNVWSLGGNSSPISCLCFDDAENTLVLCCHTHPFGDFLASGGADEAVRVWDARKKSCIQTYKGHGGEVDSLKFSPDGRWIASASRRDGLVRLWDLTAGKLLRSFAANEKSGTCRGEARWAWDAPKLRCLESEDRGAWDGLQLVRAASHRAVAACCAMNFVSVWSVALADDEADENAAPPANAAAPKRDEAAVPAAPAKKDDYEDDFHDFVEEARRAAGAAAGGAARRPAPATRPRRSRRTTRRRRPAPRRRPRGGPSPRRPRGGLSPRRPRRTVAERAAAGGEGGSAARRRALSTTAFFDRFGGATRDDAAPTAAPRDEHLRDGIAGARDGGDDADASPPPRERRAATPPRASSDDAITEFVANARATSPPVDIARTASPVPRREAALRERAPEAPGLRGKFASSRKVDDLAQKLGEKHDALF